MIYQIVCVKCNAVFISERPKKTVCPECVRKRNRGIKTRWRYSKKGKEFYKRHLIAMRKKPKPEHPPACIDCGKRLPRYKTIRCRACHHKHFRGINSPSWKGGRVRQTGGYIRIKEPNHPKANKAGYVLEHQLVWEQANNKPLPDGWHIHHLNGIPDDNRIVNLAAMPSKKHYLVLQVKAKRIQELEALINNQHQLL